MLTPAKDFLKGLLPAWLYRLASGAAKFVLMPGRTLVLLRQAAAVRGRLDYPKADIRVSVESVMEYDMRLQPCRKEPETVAWIESHVRPDDVVYDIGANIGAYSLIAAEHTAGRARIYAFEPVASNYAHLCRNILLNDRSECIIPLPFALSDGTSLERFTFSSLQTGSAEHAGIMGGDDEPAGPSQWMACIRLDDLIESYGVPAPNHIKLDVDGAELKVLAGAEKTLEDPALRTVLDEIDERTWGAERIAPILEAKGFMLASRAQHGVSAVSNYVFMKERSRVLTGD